MKKILLLVTVCSAALTGCSAAPSAFESARIQDCLEVAKDARSFADFLPGKFSSTGDGQGIVIGRFSQDTITSGTVYGDYQCSVSGTDVVFDELVFDSDK